MADETIHDVLARALDAYADLELLGEDVEDEWTYVTDLEAAWREAMDLDLVGWVANEMDGSVRCVAEGPRAHLDAFVARLEAGPPAALVERVDARWMAAIGGLGPFAVRSGAHRGD